MEITAFVGPSGTGKSYRSIAVARKYGAYAIIDDGLLISHGKVLAGTSAKKEATKITSVKHALFMRKDQAKEIREAVKAHNIQSIMILGTSPEMVQKIAANIGLPQINRYINIEDEATEEEMEQARYMRMHEGKHVIPAPTMEIKKDFSGYFLHPLRRFQKNLDSPNSEIEADKSIVRPTYSYMGAYTISNSALISIALFEARHISGVVNVHNINSRTDSYGVSFNMTVTLRYGVKIYDVCERIQTAVKESIEEYTSLNMCRVNILVKAVV